MVTEASLRRRPELGEGAGHGEGSGKDVLLQGKQHMQRP